MIQEFLSKLASGGKDDEPIPSGHAEMVPDPEALDILVKAYVRREPTAHQGGRVQAAIDLRNAVQVAAKLAGYDVRDAWVQDRASERDEWVRVKCVLVSHPDHGSVAVIIRGDRLVLRAHTPADVMRMRGVDFDSDDVDFDAYPPTNRIDDFDIKYDPVTHAFVGTKPDEFSAPVPGKVRRRRSAVAVVAEKMTELIDGQSEVQNVEKLPNSVVSMRLILEQLVPPTGSLRHLVDPSRTARIGRAEGVDIVVPGDAQMSASHFSIAWNGARATLQDLGSAAGTLVNGSKVHTRRSDLKHGDWIRAGNTDFHVYEEGFTQREPCASTPQKEAAGRLLCEHRNELYGVVDAARSLRIRSLLKESADEWQDLYDGHDRDKLGNVAPYLVKLSDARSPLLDTLVREGWGENWGIYVACPRSFKDLCRHFQGLLSIDDPVGQPMIFRFYEPRAFETSLRTFSSQWIEEVLFEGVNCFIVESQAGRAANIFRARPGHGLTEEGVKL